MSAPSRPHASPPPYLVLSIICIAVFVGSVDLTIVSAVLPRIVIDLGVSLDTELHRAAWVVSGYLLAYTISMAVMGRLSDIWGRKWLYSACLVIFLIGSGMAAIASTIDGVISGRVVQAFGAGALVPITMALVGDLFPVGERAPAFGLVAGIETLGWMVGHLYGGVLMWAFDDWRLLFWINIPLGIIALLLTWWALRGLPIERARGSFDWIGALLISGSLTTLNLGLSAGADIGHTDFYGESRGIDPATIPLLGLSLLLMLGFVWHERRSAAPLLDLDLLQQRTPARACLVNWLLGIALAIGLTNVPLFVNVRLGLSDPTNATILRVAAWDSGWLLAALTLPMGMVAVVGGWLTNRIGIRYTTMCGMGIAAVGFGLMSFWQPETGYMVMAMALIVTGGGFGLVLSPVAVAVIDRAAPDHRGSASALVILLRLVGMTLGISLLTLWGMQRQDMLRRAAADDPLVLSDPTGFLMGITTQVVSETFLFAMGLCLLGVLVAAQMQDQRG